MAEYLSKEDINTGEYISRDEALRALHQYCTDCAISCDGVMCRACDHANAMDIISDMPTANVQPIKRGEWCPPLMGQGKCSAYCSRCFGTVMRNSTGIFEETPFCPHCGADMRDATKG